MLTDLRIGRDKASRTPADRTLRSPDERMRRLRAAGTLVPRRGPGTPRYQGSIPFDAS